MGVRKISSSRAMAMFSPLLIMPEKAITVSLFSFMVSRCCSAMAEARLSGSG